MFEVTYTDFETAHPVGEVPQLKLCFNLEVTVDKDSGVYIPYLGWKIALFSVEGPDHPSKGLSGDWGIFDSVGPARFFTKSRIQKVFCTIPMSTPKIQQLVKIRAQGKMPRLYIMVTSHCLHFRKVARIFSLGDIMSHPKRARMHFKDGYVEDVTFGTDAIIRLLEEIEEYEITRIEILVRKKGKPTNKLLDEATKILDRAKQDLIAGNYDGVLTGVRNALENRILKKNEKNRWILNINIKNGFLENAPVPVEAQKAYTEVLKQIGKQFQSQLRIINEHIHRDKLQITARPQEAEEILLLTTFLVRYLSLTC